MGKGRLAAPTAPLLGSDMVMPKRKGETDEQWMNRIRAHRGLPPMDRDNLFNRCAAAKCYIQARGGDEVLELAGFMDIFHPRPEGYSRLDIQRMLK
jgi:hypothetical protein